MKPGRTLIGTLALIALLSLAAGCSYRIGNGAPAATGTPAPLPGSVSGTPETTVATVAITPSPTLSTSIPIPLPSPTMTRARPSATGTREPEGPVPGPSLTPGATLPPAAVASGTRSIAELAASDPDLSTFADALRRGGVYETLNGTETYTVFAPDDAAFEALPPGTLSRLLLDRDARAAVANYHVIHGRWLLADLAREHSVPTRSGRPLPIAPLPDGGLQVDDARVVRADIAATNGVLHVVDRVMIPPDMLRHQ